MATNSTLDVSNCQSVAEAFNHPLPQVGQFHASLTALLDDTNARLRMLVGGSYRQLLDTADTILRMSELAQRAEEKLEIVGQTCTRDSVENLTAALAKFHAKGTTGCCRASLERIAKVKSLELCTLVVRRILRGKYVSEGQARGENLVVAAKVLVVSRLLSKTVTESRLTQQTCEDKLYSGITRKLTILRHHLLQAIERILRELGSDDHEDAIIRALAAYSLATSSGTRDVLRYFLTIRSDAITTTLTQENSSEAANALTLYAQTFIYAQAIFPQRISEQLARFKSKPLLADASIRGLEELRIDEFEAWFGDDILHFTPYIRHDDLDHESAIELLKQWAEKATELLLKGVKHTLGFLDQLKSLVDIRTQILKTWMKVAGNFSDSDTHIKTFDRLRLIFLARMTRIIELRVTELDLVGKELQGTTESWQKGVSDKNVSLWDESMLNMEIGEGAENFKQQVLARTYGRNEAVSRAFNRYLVWRQIIDETMSTIGLLGKQRWDDYFEDTEDDDDLETKRIQLSVDDPRKLQEHASLCLGQAFKTLQENIESIIEINEKFEYINQISVYLLRIVRDIRSNLPNDSTPQSFGISLFAPLHERLISTVVGDHLTAFIRSLSQRKLRGRLLWEGTPELPVQPSPAAFKLLFNLTVSMGKVGGDLWSANAVLTLKTHLSANACRLWADCLQKKTELDTDVTTKESMGDQNTTDTTMDDWLTQVWFDFSLLFKNAFSNSNPTPGLADLESLIKSQTKLDPALQNHVQISAKRYWNRTSLLFGLLS